MTDLAVERLTELGFSTYEARTYVGLLSTGTATGYAVSLATGVPQPKVYETLRRLKERDAVVELPGRPVRWSAVPPDALLDRLNNSFADRLVSARDELATLASVPPDAEPQLVWRLTDGARILEAASALIASAARHVYISGTADPLRELTDPIEAGERRGVEFSILHFGDIPFHLTNGRTFRHATTDAVLRPSHRAKHLAIVVDSTTTLWSVARDGKKWEGLRADDPLLTSAVKGYIRHDIFVQRMYAAMPDELSEHFGPGLLRLADLSPELPMETSGRVNAAEA
ncbi:TrmB family transcriptional regulator [Umezawaea tangerina]|uniref:Sugar-specific transcriptional regulator TrmB n=1 Tax=Umezawaea tangerina TaxID=84725 RepID=A0A2T0T7Q1_9PSEU|nr:helix-turn-helix domain-containing protein [Umezawaea tangerina]PRY41697.1 sugar-specific transcriptional regulator TrmB [Umezawaea tangerina]